MIDLKTPKVLKVQSVAGNSKGHCDSFPPVPVD